jgi:putative nucleotidyltransferase with HDIG domain
MTVQPAKRAQLPQAVRALIEARLQGELELPFLPQTSSQVLSLCNEQSCDARKLSDLIQRDPSLAGHVLKVANSAAYAPTEPIHSLLQAVSRLGMVVVCEISVAVSLRGRVFEVPGFQPRVRAIWAHSAATAVYAKEVARLLRRNVEGAFLCGLLHDVGKPIVLQELVDISRERTTKPVPSAIGEAAMDEYHLAIGARLVEFWKLAPWMAEVVRFHHDPEAAPQYAEEARITRLADLLAHWALGKLDPAELATETQLLSNLNLYPEDLEKLKGMRAQVIQVAEAFR